MPDYRFFKKPSSFTLSELAEKIGAQVGPGSDPSFAVEDVLPLDKAGPRDLSFFDNIKYKEQYLATKAGACVVSEDMAKLAPQGLHVLVSRSPYKSYALAAQAFYPEPRPAASISDRAYIDPTAKLGEGCTIEAGAVIGAGAELGAQCRVEHNAVIGNNVVMGEKCRVGANATVSHAVIGSHVRLYPGVRIGQDGFGFAIDPRGHVKVPQLGRVMIGDHVEIGANTCVDRGSGPDTEIGSGAWIDNLVQIGHNVKIGRGCVIAAQVGFAGSTVIEDFVALGGQAGVAGHLRIGKGAQIAAQTGVIQDVEAGSKMMGYPAVPLRHFMKQAAILKRLANPKKTG